MSGHRERPIPPQPDWIPDGMHCQCRARLNDGTDGKGHAIQWCNACGRRMSVLPIRPSALPPEPVAGIVSAPVRPCAGGCGTEVAGRFKYCPDCATRDKRAARRLVRPRERPCATPECSTLVSGRFDYCAPCGMRRDKENRRSWHDRKQAARALAGRAA